MARNDKAPFALMPDEEVLLITRPHALAMLGLMVFWLSLAGLGGAYTYYYEDLTGYLQGLVKIKFLATHGYDVIWFASILVPLVIMAVFRINFGYVLTLLGLMAGNVLLQWKVEPRLDLPSHAHLENYMLIGVGVIGVIGCELFRRGHRYFLTTNRIVARFGTLKVSERSTLYSKIDDLILQKGLLGNVLNYGTVIPITSTGLGMGSDLAIAGAAAGGGKAGISAGVFAAGGKAANVPRDMSIYVLYKIKRPEEARNTILQEMQARERPRNMIDPDDSDSSGTL